MCKIPLNSPVQTVEIDIEFSEDESDVTWSEFESTISTSVTLDTLVSSNPSNSTVSQSFSTADTTISFDGDFRGFTDDDLACVGTDGDVEEEYYLTDYSEVTSEVEYLDQDEESDTVEINSDEENWSGVSFEEDEECYILLPESNYSLAPDHTHHTSDTLNDFNYCGYYEECEEDEQTIPLDGKLVSPDSSAMLNFYQEEIAECAKEVHGITRQNQLDQEYGFDVSTIPLPGEDSHWIGDRCTCHKWLPYDCDQSKGNFVLSELFTCDDLTCLDETMSLNEFY